LIRDVLYQGLPAERLAWLHGRAGEAIEELYGDAAEHLAAIAAHYLRAAPLGGAERALRYAQLAGERALAMLGWQEAAGHFEGALGVLDLEPAAADLDRRCDLHLSLGHARVRAGQTQAARQAFLAAADLARTSGDALRLAGAALGLGRASPIWGLDPELVELLERARDGLECTATPPWPSATGSIHVRGGELRPSRQAWRTSSSSAAASSNVQCCAH
jgi:roadblock/LC7 domain-containing protein